MKYILLTPIQPSMFDQQAKNNTQADWDALLEAAEEFGCYLLHTTDPLKNHVGFFMSDTKEAIESMVNQVDLDGPMIEAVGIFDQMIQTTTVLKG